MPHFFINSNQINNKIIEISDKENYNHLARSLRSRAGEKLLLIDENQIQYETIITEITGSKILAKIEKSYPSKRYLDFELYLGQSPLRSDAQNLLIEKATELGVTGVFPVITDNCAVAKSVIEKKIPKWQKIMYESSKQCERSDILKVLPAVSLDDIINSSDYDIKIACVERDDTLSLKACLRNLDVNDNSKLLVIIGPEGGFSAAELQLLNNSDVYKVSLGKLILRAETAVISAISNIVYELENTDECQA